MVRIPAERIAIVKLGAIGDAVNVLPFVQRLRAGYPSASITWIVGPAAHALVGGHPAIDRFRVFDARDRSSWSAFARTIRAERFDLAIDLQRILKSGIITLATGARVRLGFDRARCKEASWLFTNRRIPPNARPGVTVEQYLEFADWLECPRVAPSFELPFDPFPRSSSSRARVVVNVGASKPANRWSAAQWARTCELLARELDAEIHLTGGNVDREAVDATIAACSVPLVDHAGKRTLRETAGILRSADLFVGGDTGPLHMAVALGVPVVAVFGAADPARTGPFEQPGAVVRHAVACSPCRRRTCNVDGHPCMRDLAPELVVARARDVLAARVR